MFLGFLNTGDWVRFDEFNRIEVKVLIIFKLKLVVDDEEVFANVLSSVINDRFQGEGNDLINGRFK